MTWLTFTNVVTTACAFVMVWAAVEIHRITRSRSMLLLVISTGYLLAVRLIVSVAEVPPSWDWAVANRSYLIAPFWPLMAASLILLLHSLRSIYIRQDRRRKNGSDYSGPERGRP